MIQDALNNYLYDAKGRLCAVENLLTTSATEYVYDADGDRVAKGNWTGIGWPAVGHTWAAGAVPNCSTPTAANGFTLTAIYLRGAGGTQDVEIDPAQGSTPAGWRQNVFADGGLLATYSQSGTAAPALFFDFNDWLGTKRLQVNAAGQAVNYWGSDPFGDYLTPHVTGNDGTNHHFTGKERDQESQLDYFGARYYPSTMGRWLASDTDMTLRRILPNPQRWNRYAYVIDNPLARFDPDGNKDQPFNSQTDTPVNLKAPGATPIRFSDGTFNRNAYNCHSFAWENGQGDPTDPRNAWLVSKGITKWDENPDNNMGGTISWVRTIQIARLTELFITLTRMGTASTTLAKQLFIRLSSRPPTPWATRRL